MLVLCWIIFSHPSSEIIICDLSFAIQQSAYQLPLREKDLKEKTGCMSKIWNGPRSQKVSSDVVGQLSCSTFSEIERTALLAAIWSDNSANEPANVVKERSIEARRFMCHMALSNTVKPFLDGSMPILPLLSALVMRLFVQDSNLFFFFLPRPVEISSRLS